MNFEGEHLLPGQIGHLLVILAFFSSIVATVSYFFSIKSNSANDALNWTRLARGAFLTQALSGFIVFGIIIYICSNHYFEYMYAYKHASLELEYKYLLACIWEGQEGSFLLWSLWHSILGLILMRRAGTWEQPVIGMLSLAQLFLMLMILGIYVGDIRIGNSLFALTRNEIEAPIFSQPNYLNFIRDGLGLNVLLRNYWMVIHPPVLFLGFALTLVPFAYATGGLITKRYGDWVKPAMPWALACAALLGAGIMMGGKWAYESLSFGGYWAWDPVENASLVPWLIMIAGLHTMLIYKATGHSLKASYLFMILSFVFVLYSTFLTRTGILGDTSVHSFTEAGSAINIMIGLFVLSFTVPPLALFIMQNKQIPSIQKEESTSSREFWMYVGSLVIFLTAIFIIAKTSFPVYNKVFGTNFAPPEDVEFSFNKVVILVAIIIGILSAIGQYLKYKSTGNNYFLRKIMWPTLVAALITGTMAIYYPFEYYKYGAGFLGAIYTAMFASVYAVVANGFYIFSVLKGKFRVAGGSVAHLGFSLMIAGMLISSSNKQVISSSLVNGITFASGTDPMTKQADDPQENLTLIRDVPTRMGPYEVTYTHDSLGHEKGRKFYHLEFREREGNDRFVLNPDVYLMKDNNMSSNPDTRSYLTKDIFTYISYALNDKQQEDTTSFRESILHEGDTVFYSNGYIILNKVFRNPSAGKYNFKSTDAALAADLTVVSKDTVKYAAMPAIQVMESAIIHHDDTLYAQNLFLRFSGVTDDHQIKLGIKESDRMIDFVTVKTYVFPFINLVWLGLIMMCFGVFMSMVYRANWSPLKSGITLLLLAIGLFYMFLLANN